MSKNVPDLIAAEDLQTGKCPFAHPDVGTRVDREHEHVPQTLRASLLQFIQGGSIRSLQVGKIE